MSRITALVLAATSALALSVLAGPEAGSTAAPQTAGRVGNWCC